MQLSDWPSRLAGLGPVAAAAAGVEDQARGAVLEVCLPSAALVELVLVCGVGVHAVGLAHAEVGVHAAGATGAAPTGATTGTAPGTAPRTAPRAAPRAASTGRGHSLDGREGSRRRRAGYDG